MEDAYEHPWYIGLVIVNDHATKVYDHSWEWNNDYTPKSIYKHERKGISHSYQGMTNCMEDMNGHAWSQS